MTSIVPRYRVLLKYNIHPEHQDRYYRYMIAELVPQMRKLGMYMIYAWNVAYGPYPERQVEFVCEDKYTLKTILEGDEWAKAEAYLQEYTTQYSRKIVHFQNRFQF